jgi:uncharacterized metal-binding protein
MEKQDARNGVEFLRAVDIDQMAKQVAAGLRTQLKHFREVAWVRVYATDQQIDEIIDFAVSAGYQKKGG